MIDDMENFLWLFSRFTLALILLVTIFNKTDSPLFELNTSASGAIQKTLQVFENFHRPISFFLIFALLNTGTMRLTILAASMQLGILFINKTLKQMHVINQCNCYGSIAKGNSAMERMLDVILLFCCASIIALGIFSRANEFIENYFFPGDFFLVALLIATALYLAIKKISMLGLQSAEKQKEINTKARAEKRIFPEKMLMGKNEEGKEINLEHLAEPKSLLLFIGLSSSCASCEYAKPDLISLADSFQSKIQTVFVFDENVTSLPQLNGSIAIKGEEFAQFVKPEGYPFAVVINPDNYAQVGTVAYTSKNIWMLFYFAIGLLEPVTA